MKTGGSKSLVATLAGLAMLAVLVGANAAHPSRVASLPGSNTTRLDRYADGEGGRRDEAATLTLTSVHPDNAIDAPFAKSVGLTDCGDCNAATGGQCELEIGHEAEADDGGLYSEGTGWHPESCRVGTCSEKHPGSCACYCEAHNIPPGECSQHCTPPGGEEDAVALRGGPDTPATGFLVLAHLPEVWAAVRSGKVTPAVVVSQYRNVEWNARRRALQVLGCNGDVVAHVPLKMKEHYMVSAAVSAGAIH